MARFIPTRVGNTTKRGNKNGKKPVHPHACGEYLNEAEMAEFKSGSSPRVWGIRVAPARGLLGKRFIPTRVGNTHTQTG